MKRDILTPILCLAILFLAIIETQHVNFTSANFIPPPPELPYAYIKADGTVEPETLPIHRAGNTYTLTGNITHCTLVIQCSDVVLDGAGYTLQGNDTGKGIILENTNNVTIRKLTLRNLRFGIYFQQSTECTITQNDIALTEVGIFIGSSSNNNIVGNNITGNFQGVLLIEYSNYNSIVENCISENSMAGILLEFANNHTSNYNNIIRNTIANNGVFGIRVSSSFNCRIEGNNITGSECGMQLHGSACRNNRLIGNWITNCSCAFQMTGDCNHNTIAENVIANNQVGIDIFASSNNEFYRNDFVKNNLQVNNGYVENDNLTIGASINTWSRGSEGNFWSDYNGTDFNGDGIGDTPYVIDASNKDNRPFMKPLIFPAVTIPDSNEGKENGSTTQNTEPFPNALAITISVVSFVAVFAGLLVYFKKRKRGQPK